jgi:hypothetical protein
LKGPESGRADLVALVVALVLVAAAAAPDLRTRTGRTWEQARHMEPWARPRPDGPAAGSSSPLRTALARAESAVPDLAAADFRPDPSRRIGPLPAAPGPSGGGGSGQASGPRVTDLDGRVREGRLFVGWTQAPGSRATALRIEGLGGSDDSLEQEVPSDLRTLEVPVPGTSGTILVRAAPVGLPGTAAEARVSIPYRIPVEVVRAERAHGETGSVFIVLRRPFDGRSVESEFALQVADPVGGLASAGPAGSVVDFHTDFVVEEVRDRTQEGPSIDVPQFSPDGRVQRDGEGRPVTYRRITFVSGGHEIVLRGPNDERRVLTTR